MVLARDLLSSHGVRRPATDRVEHVGSLEARRRPVRVLDRVRDADRGCRQHELTDHHTRSRVVARVQQRGRHVAPGGR